MIVCAGGSTGTVPTPAPPSQTPSRAAATARRTGRVLKCWITSFEREPALSHVRRDPLEHGWRDDARRAGAPPLLPHDIHANAHSSAHASAVPAVRSREHGGYRRWGGRGGRCRGRHGAAAQAGSASPAVPVRKDRSNASSTGSWRAFSGRIRGGVRAARRVACAILRLCYRHV
jgi:hypothetical protein